MAANREQLQAFFEQHKGFIFKVVLPFFGLVTLSELSAISTLYGAQDALREFLTLIGYFPHDSESVGYDFESAGGEHSLAATIFAEILLWAYPILLTVDFNAILRAMPVPTAINYFKELWAKGASLAWAAAALFFVPAIASAAGDTLNNVLLSQKLKDEWPTLAIYTETVLSFTFLMPLNFYFISIFFKRAMYAWNKYFKNDDLKLAATQFKIISYLLRKIAPEAQAKALQDLYTAADLNRIRAPITFEGLERNFEGKNFELLKSDVATICERLQLRDGNSNLSTFATGITVLLSLGSAAVTARTPYLCFTGVLNFPVWAAGLITANSAAVKFMTYLGSYDSLMLMFKHWNILFGASPIKWGIATVLAVLSGIGFLEVAQNGVNVAFSSMSEDLPWCYWSLVSMFFLAGPVTNLNSFYLAALKVLQELKKVSPDYSPDLADGFAELEARILTMPSIEKVPSAEEERLLSPDDGSINVPMQDMSDYKGGVEEFNAVVVDSAPPRSSRMPCLSGCCFSLFGSSEPRSRTLVDRALGPFRYLIPNF